jgi:hypothetical protein
MQVRPIARMAMPSACEEERPLAQVLHQMRAVAAFSIVCMICGAQAQTAANAELPDSPSAVQSSSSTQAPAVDSSPAKPATAPDFTTLTPEEKRRLAEEQLQQQEHQRVAGVMATFNTTTNMNALPLSSKQKFRLFIRSAMDPWPFFLAGTVGAIGQARNTNPEWGQGIQGYMRRSGAAYGDTFVGNFLGNALLPSLLHEDPRYFQMRSGRPMKRLLWAASSTVWCRRDNGKWGVNYANIGGNLIGTAITRVAYYPDSARTVGDTIQDGLTVTAEGIIGAEVIEFWPDLARHMKKKHDAKVARKQAEADARAAASSPQ